MERESLSLSRREKSKCVKTPPWKMSELLYVLKQIKHGKSRDPLHMINEIFYPDVAGQDLVKAILNLMNGIKSDQIFPKCMTLCNISKI